MLSCDGLSLAGKSHQTNNKVLMTIGIIILISYIQWPTHSGRVRNARTSCGCATFLLINPDT